MLCRLLLLCALAGQSATDAVRDFSNGTEALWAARRNGRVGDGLGPNFALLRPPTLRLGARVANMTVLVSAAPDPINQGQLLGRYQLYVNGVHVAVGPGRADRNLLANPNDAVFDRIEVPATVLSAENEGDVSVALQCLNQNSTSNAWVMLEAEFVGASGVVLGRLATSARSWHAYDADDIFSPGQLDTGSGHVFVNENIDARSGSKVRGWRLPSFDPANWAKPVVRKPQSMPVAKTTQPLTVEGGLAPSKIVQVSATRYFFDMGQERMGGVQLDVPAGTVRRWGGSGTHVEVRLSEMVSDTDPRAVLWPGAPFDIANWNKIPKWSSVLTLADGESRFEQHEYIGPWRYGEIRIQNADAEDCKLDFNLSQWTVGYPWRDEAVFSSSDSMLDSVWNLCRNTLRYTTLDTFTDSNVRERMPYEADLFCAAGSYWALRSERELVRHSAQYVISNPTWPTEWKQYTVLLAHGHYMQTGDASLVDANFESLVNNTMLPFIDPRSQLVNFSASYVGTEGECPLFPTGAICNSPQCHNDTDEMDTEHSDAGKRCDNIDWLPKFRADYIYSNTSTIINAFAVRSLAMLSELAQATGRHESAAKLAEQSKRTKDAMIQMMFSENEKLWCDGLCVEMYTPRSSALDMAWWRYNGTSFHSQHYALSLGITPEDAVPTAQRYLRDKGMVGSTYSANSLLHGLYDAAYWVDYGATALELMTQCTPHSWCHMLSQNATTTWEHWYEHDGTHSHVWSASPAGAIAAGLMGVKPTKPGWSQWIARPAPGNLSAAQAVVPTPRGSIAAKFSREDDVHDGYQSWQLDLSVPGGTEATVCLPLFGAKLNTCRVTLNGKVMSGQSLRSDHGSYVCIDGIRESATAMVSLCV